MFVLSLLYLVGLSVTGRLDGAIGLRICLVSVVLGGSKFGGGGGGAIWGEGLGIGGTGGRGCGWWLDSVVGACDSCDISIESVIFVYC